MHRLFTYINSFQKHFSSHVLLYHSTYHKAPENIEKGLHNVLPGMLEKQIRWLKENFDIVFVDELFKSDDINGKAAITFDDGYKSVFQNTIPLIKSLGVPTTIFLNGSMFDDKPFWRDKIRFLINNTLVEQFISYIKSKNLNIHLSDNNFYFDTKNKINNSLVINKICDDFLYENNIDIKFNNYGLNQIKELEKHPLISYGNHTYNHYVLSSLSRKEQEYEIRRNHDFLKKLNIKKSNIFSIPFGDKDSFNTDTIEIIEKYGYSGILLPDDMLNFNNNIKYQYLSNLKYLQRYTVPENHISFQFKIFKIFIKTILKSF